MKRLALLFPAVALFAGLESAAANYTWKDAADGVWEVPANWGSETAYPGSDPDQATVQDTASLRTGTYTVTASGDISVWSAQAANDGSRPTIDMNGHTFTYVNPSGNGFTINGSHDVGYTLDDDSSHVTFLNGVFDIRKFFLGYAGGSLSGGFTVGRNATLTGSISFWDNGSRIKVKDGGVWNCNGSITYGNHSSNRGYGYMMVTGATSKIDMKGCSVTVRGDCCGIYAFAGGVITNVGSISVGSFYSSSSGNAASDDTFIDLRGGSIHLSSALSLGWTADAKCYPRVSFAGADSFLSAKGTMTVYGTLGTKFAFDLSDGAFTNAAGAVRAPLKVGGLAFTARDSSYASCGDTKITVTGYTWMRQHGGEVVPLVELTTADAAGLATLASYLSTEGFPTALFKGLPTLVVSDDAKTLSVRIPEAQAEVPISFTASAAPSTVESNVTFSVSVLTYGGSASGATIKALVSTDPEYAGAVEHVLWEDVSDAPPWEKSTDVSGFPQHAHYYAKVILTNDEDGTATNEIEFTSGGYAETFQWTNTLGGCWQDVGNWDSANTTFKTQPTYPHAEDKVADRGTLYAFAQGTYTVTADEDLGVKTLGNIRSNVTLDLQGHRLDFTKDAIIMFYCEASGDNFTRADDRLPKATLILKNGTAVIQSGGTFQFVGANGTGNGGLVLDGCDFTGNPVFWGNASRLWVRNGGVWRTQSVTMDNWAAALPWGYIRVSGEGSRIVCESGSITVRGPSNGFIVEDGASAQVNSLQVGYTDGNCYAGDVASTNTYVTVSNATLRVSSLNMGWNSNKMLSPRLNIIGPRALVVASGEFLTWGRLNLRIRFDVPEDGFTDETGAARVPFQVGKYLIHPRSEYTDWGPTRVEVSARPWFRKHANGRIALMTLTTANTAYLQALADSIDLVGYPAGRSSSFRYLTVSDDGKTLFLNAPPRKGMSVLVK